jgi:hypothetical protein
MSDMLRGTPLSATACAAVFDFFHTASIEVVIHAMILGLKDTERVPSSPRATDPRREQARLPGDVQFLSLVDTSSPNKSQRAHAWSEGNEDPNAVRHQSHGSDHWKLELHSMLKGRPALLSEHFSPYLRDYESIYREITAESTTTELAQSLESSTDVFEVSMEEDVAFRLFERCVLEASSNDAYLAHLISQWYEKIFLFLLLILGSGSLIVYCLSPGRDTWFIQYPHEVQL